MFEHLDITSPMDVYQRVAYTKRIPKGAVIQNYREVMVKSRKLAKELTGDEWNLGELAGLSVDNFWDWDKTDTM